MNNKVVNNNHNVRNEAKHLNESVNKVNANEKEGIRLNKFISDAGICSRRQADKYIEAGEVYVDGKPATMGCRVTDKNKVMLNGKLVSYGKKHVYYAYNKPIGQVCTSKEADKESIFNYVEFPERVSYVGRLDKDSSGLLILTNDGELSNSVQKSRNNHDKVYMVRVNKDITDEFLNGMSNGVPILDTVTKKCKVVKTGARTFKITLTQGLNRQIRRMCDYFNYRVVNLKRVRVLNVSLGDLRPGEYRRLSREEEEKLKKLVEND